MATRNLQLVLPDPVVVGSQAAHDVERPDLETASDKYASRFAGPAGEWLLRRQRIAVDALLDAVGPDPLRVLDVGGGHAQIAPLLVERGHSVVIHGSARESLGRVADLRRSAPAQVGAAASNLWALPFRDAAFDLTIAIRLFAHVARWRELLAEMARVSGRYILVEFPRAGTIRLPQAANDLVFSFKNRVERTTRPFFSYREAAIQQEFARNGYRLLARTGQFALPMVVHRAAGAPRVSERIEDGLRILGIGDRIRSPALLLAERIEGA